MFSIPVFRAQFPAFTSTIVWPDETIQLAYEMSGCYVDAAETWYSCTKCRDLITNLITAHLLLLNGSAIAPANGTAGKVASASVGSVSVSFVDVTSGKSQFSIWLSKTPYGEQLLVLFSKVVAGGFYVGGSPERRGFRKVGGRF
ncbi:head to tail adaptor [Yersinia phage vB_YenM_P744]